MGGFGSGNHGGRPIVESCLSLDINQLNRIGLSHGWHGNFSWRDACGEELGSFTLCNDPGQLTVTGRLNGEPLRQFFFIIRTPCFFGGSRSWFLCPYCSKPVGKLYLGNDGFACRQCYRLTYACTREDSWDRMWRKMGKLEARLGEDGTKPTGMHWRTYYRILDRL
ncbi:MAG: hypothetical protein H8E39_00005 [Alphaproteobacteria bacterium]|nr:hypothetical protein [Alphaproteobacteria bacterium]